MAVSFDRKRRLGAGHFGEVWHAVDTGLDCEVALKCIPPDRIVNPDNFFQEAQVLRASEHPNIVRVNETGTLDDGSIYVSMEYLPAGSLEDEAKGAPVPLPRAKRLMIDVLRGLGHAHSQGVVHRDIKPANIMIGNNGEGKLSDFGLALPDVTRLDLSRLKQYQYLMHLAPEVNSLGDYTALCDVYACGVTLYRMVNGDGNLPPIRPAEAQALARRGEFPPRDRYRDFVPPALKRVINKALSANPAERYQSADDMRRALERLTLNVGWSESSSPTRSVWTGQDSEGRRVEVVKAAQSDGTWLVSVRRSTPNGSMRKIHNIGWTELSAKDATRQAAKVLHDLVLGRL